MLLSIMYSSIAYTQSVKKQKQIKVYRIWLMGEKEIDGLFYEATESSIIILPNTDKWQEIDKNSLIEVPAKEIYKIKLRRLKSIGHGAKVGAIIGFVPIGIGGIIFFSAVARDFGDELEPGAAVVFGLMAGGIGTGIGAAFGSIKTNYKINYSQDRYQADKPKFIRKSLKAQVNISQN